MIPNSEEFDPAKAHTLMEQKLKNHDDEYDCERLLSWAKKNADAVASFFGFDSDEELEPVHGES